MAESPLLMARTAMIVLKTMAAVQKQMNMGQPPWLDPGICSEADGLFDQYGALAGQELAMALVEARTFMHRMCK